MSSCCRPVSSNLINISPNVHVLKALAIPDHIQKDVVPKFYFEDSVEQEYKKDYKRSVNSLYIGVSLRDVKGDAHTRGELINLKGIFDTGAQSVCVDVEHANRMDWPVVGHARVSGATASEDVPVFKGSLSIHFDGADVLVQNVLVWGARMPGDIDVLVGKPIIALKKFLVKQGFKGVVWGSSVEKTEKKDYPKQTAYVGAPKL